MYKIKLPYKDLMGGPHTEVLYFNLYEREVFKLLLEFKTIFAWRDSIRDEEVRILSDEETIEFYNNLEAILLAAYGVPWDDGRGFDHSGRYRFEESVMFNELMKMFLSDQKMANELIDGLMPKGLQEMVERADANLAELAKSDETPAALQAEIARLRKQVEDANTPPAVAAPQADA